MARMTAQDIVTEVRLHLGGETTETISDNQILRWVNRTYVDLASAYEFHELETSASLTLPAGDSEPEIAGVTDILDIISITNTTDKMLMYPWTRWQYDRATQGNAASITGPPIYWFESGVESGLTSITLYPTPAVATAVTVVYRKVPTELVLTPAADVTSSVLSEPWDEVLILLAVSRGWRALGDDDKSYKAKLSANDASKIAEQSSFTASYVPMTPGSVVGRALRNG